jgi:photosystem II stability/assembly factor-like uncharacterized protein
VNTGKIRTDHHGEEHEMSNRGLLVSPVLLATGLLLAAVSPGLAVDHWVSHGPYGGSTSVLIPSAHQEGGLYAAVLGYGVFRIPGGSDTWTQRSNGFDYPYLRALVQDPLQPDVLYAGATDGIYWTTDGGLNWEPRNGGTSPSHVSALAIDPVRPWIVYAGAIWGDWAVYKTVNSGATWEPTGPGIPLVLHITALLVDPVNSDIVYAATEDPHNYLPDEAGVYKSVDGGASWLPSGDGLLNPQVRTLTFDPSSSQRIYAGVYSNEYVTSGGVYVSEDAGRNWARISNGLPDGVELAVEGIAVAPGGPPDEPTLFAAATHEISLPQPPGTWEPRLYRSTNGGASWERSAAGIVFPDMLSVLVDPDDPEIVYAGTNTGGVFRSTDGGDNWSHWSDGLARLGVFALTMDPGDENTLYAGTVAYFAVHEPHDAGVYASFDGGLTWQPRPRNLRIGDSFYVSSLAVAECGPPAKTVYAPSFGWMLYKSTDQGLSWDWRGWSHGIGGYWLRTVVVDPSDPSVAYVSGAGFEPSWPDIYKTTDCGESWTAVASDLIWLEFMGLAIDPNNPQKLYAGTAWEGVWKTVNGGSSWQPTGFPMDTATAKSVAIDPRMPGHVYVGDNQWGATGVYMSTDGGREWELFNQGLGHLDVEALVIDAPPAGDPDPMALYAGTEGGGVYRRREGEAWMPVNAGLEELRVYSLALGPPASRGRPTETGRLLFAGTAAGAYRWAASGDFDGNGVVDALDLEAFRDCYAGGDVDFLLPDCVAGDFDGDDRLTCHDWASFKEVWSEPEPPVLPYCPDACCLRMVGSGSDESCEVIIREQDCVDGWAADACLGDGDGDGIDDACEPVSGLTLLRDGSSEPASTTFSWTCHPSSIACDVRYDLVTGDLSTLRGAGNFTPSVGSCVANDETDLNFVESGGEPDPGSARWYLLRGVWYTPDLIPRAMTYDAFVPGLGTGQGQHHARDEEIEASAFNCP